MTELDFLRRAFEVQHAQVTAMAEGQRTLLTLIEEVKNSRSRKEWVSPTDEEILEVSKDAWGRDKLSQGRADHTGFYVAFARLLESKLKEKNND